MKVVSISIGILLFIILVLCFSLYPQQYSKETELDKIVSIMEIIWSKHIYIQVDTDQEYSKEEEQLKNILQNLGRETLDGEKNNFIIRKNPMFFWGVEEELIYSLVPPNEENLRRTIVSLTWNWYYGRYI